MFREVPMVEVREVLRLWAGAPAGAPNFPPRLCYGLPAGYAGPGGGAARLRRELAQLVQQHHQ